MSPSILQIIVELLTWTKVCYTREKKLHAGFGVSKSCYSHEHEPGHGDLVLYTATNRAGKKTNRSYLYFDAVVIVMAQIFCSHQDTFDQSKTHQTTTALYSLLVATNNTPNK